MRAFFCITLLLIVTACKKEAAPSYKWLPLEVTVTAYNTTPAQTSGNPVLAAWGDTLKPGMKSIAVSRDLIRKGLKHNTQVKIEGMPGIYLVKDKMHAKHRNKIDIFMGKDIQKAKEWGIQKRTIHYRVSDTLSRKKKNLAS